MAMHEGLEVSVSTIRERLFMERLRLVQPEKADALPKMKVKDRARYIEDNWKKLFPGPDPALLRVVKGPVQKLVTKGMDGEADEVVHSHLEPQIKAKMHNTTGALHHHAPVCLQCQGPHAGGAEPTPA